MWDMRKVTVVETFKGKYSLSVKCSTVYKKTCSITNVYGLCDYRERRSVWLELFSLLDYCFDAWCMEGDFNITYWAYERFPFNRITRGMRPF